MYEYRDRRKVLLAKSNSPIEFNTGLFPIFKDIEPTMTNEKGEERADDSKLQLAIDGLEQDLAEEKRKLKAANKKIKELTKEGGDES